MNYFRMYVGDYLRDTTRLTLLEHGAYHQLLSYYYAEEKPLPREHHDIFRMLRALSVEEHAAVRRVLDTFFDLRADGWHNARADAEIAVARTSIEASRANGAKGGRPAAEPVVDDSTGGAEPVETTRQVTRRVSRRQPAGSADGVQPPTPNPQPPTATPQPPTPRGRRSADAPDTRETWAAYAAAYQERYNVAPVRNARVNAQLLQVVRAIGVTDAPAVARFFLTHNDRFYVRRMHSVGQMLADAEKLRSEWATGARVTDASARQVERAAGTREAFDAVLSSPHDVGDARTSRVVTINDSRPTPEEAQRIVEAISAQFEPDPVPPHLRPLDAAIRAHNATATVFQSPRRRRRNEST